MERLGHEPQAWENSAAAENPLSVKPVHSDCRTGVDDNGRRARRPPRIHSHGVEESINPNFVRMFQSYLKRQLSRLFQQLGRISLLLNPRQQPVAALGAHAANEPVERLIGMPRSPLPPPGRRGIQRQ